MSNRLPCHKGIGRRPRGPPRSANHVMGIPNHQRKRSTINDNIASANRTRLIPGEVPYVSHDGGRTRYYADRCYLDAPTGLLEYQIAEKERSGQAASDVEYCNFCGEIRDTQQFRGTIGANNNSPSATRPLFDRAKFINSLDLSAAVVGTYTIADFEYLSKEFPMLFPRLDDKRSNSRRHVPTLVLHGQKGFSLERWSSSANAQPQENSAAKEPGTSGNSDEAMSIRGGGNSSSQDSTNQTRLAEQVAAKSIEGDKKSPAEKKRPCLTFDGHKLKLPRTPKRLRTTKKKKKASQNNAENNCRDVNAGENTTKSGSTSEIIVIDSDSEDEPEPADTAKQTITAPASATPKSPPASSTAHDCDALSPPLNSQKPRISMPMKNAPPPPELSDVVSSSSKSKQLPIPTKEPSISEDSPQCSPPPQQQTAASILSRVMGKPLPKATMRPIFYNSGPDSSQDSSISVDITSKTLQSGIDNNLDEKKAAPSNQPRMGWGALKPASAFGGEVFFTQVLPRWRPPSPKTKKRRPSTNNCRDAAAEDQTKAGLNAASAEYSDNEGVEENRSGGDKQQTTTPEEDDEMKTVRGVHHPKFFLLFERSGSLVVIISTSNLSPQKALDGSWVQRFEPKESSPRPTYINRGGGSKNANGNVDFGMPSDFGAVLTDFLKKQSEAAADGTMLPDVFLRRYVSGLSSGLNTLSDRYQFDSAQVHLVSTVPGDHLGGLPRRCHRDATYKPRISYGPQRVSFILSRILNKSHIGSACAVKAAATGRLRGGRMEATIPWLPPSLMSAKERLVIQPTSLGGNWTREHLELIAQTYLDPESTAKDRTADGPLEMMDIVWPAMDYFNAMRSKRRAIWEKHPDEAAAITKQRASTKKKEIREGHVFLSSVSFSKLDRSCISRLTLFTQQPNVMPYKSTSLHFKSVCRLLRLNEEKPDAESSKKSVYRQSKKPNTDSKEYLSWFMLTSSCLSKGAQGQPTPYRNPESDCTSYSNFELGILFCSRLLGDNVHDRLYVSDPNHLCGCQCGKGKRLYKEYFDGKGSDRNAFLECVKKVHLPIPYQLRPTSYQDDPDSDFMCKTPYMHEILDGTGCVGNMKLTPLGQQIARDANKEEDVVA
ncbi:hypothetical protein ACHAXR_009399 [Thalassiosira sp. AJA248-18]